VPVPISRDTLAGVPVLLAGPAPHAGRTAGDRPPIVLWFHGFRADAAANATELAAIAADGYLAVGVDAVDHGARRADDLDARMATTPGGARAVMLALAAATTAELPALVAALGARGLGDPRRVGIVGVSMGGYLAYRAARALPGVRAVVAVLGSPEWGAPGSPGPDSPHAAPHAFRDVALLSITAERDASVPPEAARRFHAELAAGHPAPERARYLELPGAEHLVSAGEWDRAMTETREWLRAHLAP
jgi:dienelactone hydrolase